MTIQVESPGDLVTIPTAVRVGIALDRFEVIARGGAHNPAVAERVNNDVVPLRIVSGIERRKDQELVLASPVDQTEGGCRPRPRNSYETVIGRSDRGRP